MKLHRVLYPAMVLLLALPVHAQTESAEELAGRARGDIRYFRTHGNTQGVYEIFLEAQSFVAAENKKNGTHWIATEPDIRIAVPRCVKPLTAAWASKNYGLSQKSVVVFCSETVIKNSGNKDFEKWHVFVPVTTNARDAK
ncbi:MAG: hypothetical protein LBV44_06090 [Methylobacillus sp.]|jgi:hypothetical protein|nr:hypothetical protein [Methylobacillus sp.]